MFIFDTALCFYSLLDCGSNLRESHLFSGEKSIIKVEYDNIDSLKTTEDAIGGITLTIVKRGK